MDKALEAGRPPRELLWNEYCDEQGQPDRWDAETPFNTYYDIALLHDGYSVQHDYADVAKALPSLNGAKAAAVADCLRRCSLYLAALPADTSGLVERLRSLADCDARAGEPLGKCMREAADAFEALQGAYDGCVVNRDHERARAESAEARLAVADAVISNLVDHDLAYDGGNIVIPTGDHGNAIALVSRARSYLEGRK